jgi:gliding motility-associated-like protein
MDYGNFNCMKVFTQGQADRMNWHIQNVRKSLLACKSCMPPCPAPVTANFTAPAGVVNAGTAYTFTNTSTNAATYDWYVNGVLQASTPNFTFNFPAIGTYIIRMVAQSGDALCTGQEKAITLQAVCPVAASFTRSAASAPAGSNINFTNTTIGADTYEWFVNGISQSSATNFSYTSTTGGQYIIRLLARNTPIGCQKEFTDTVEFTCPVTASFTPAAPTTSTGTPITFTSTGSGAITHQWLVEGIAAGTNPTLTYAFTTSGLFRVKLIVSNGTCTAEATGYVYVTDQCSNPYYLFQKNYAQGTNSGAYDIQSTTDGGSIIAERLILTGGTFQGALLKLDAAGSVEWANTYGNNGPGNLFKVRQTADGGYIAIGTTGSPEKLFIVKTLATGSIGWSREYAIGSYAVGRDIRQGSDGNYYFVCSANPNNSLAGLDVLAGKLDAGGGLIWLKAYDARGSEEANGIAEDNGNLVITGNLFGPTQEGFLLKVQQSDGAVLWSNKYLSVYENFKSVQTGTDGYYIDGVRRSTAGGLFTDHIFLKTDFNGNISLSKYQRPFTATGKGMGGIGLILQPNGNLVLQSSPEFGGTPEDVYLQEVNAAGSVIWTKKYNKPVAWMNAIAKTAENGILVGGSTLDPAPPSLRAYVMRLDTAGNSGGCPVTPVTIELLNAPYNVSPVTFTSSTVQPQAITNHTASLFPSTTHVECQITKCDAIPPVDTCGIPCTTTGIAGADSICHITDTITYLLQRNSNCPASANWTFDAAFVDTIATSDSTMTVRFKRTGTTVLYATLITPCKTWRDSLSIAIFHAPDSLKLGPDITLCKISSYTLRAGSGFASYRWQDGSADSTFTLYEPGIYYVEAADQCGNLYRDTVTVTQSPDIPFDLGPDLVACKNDTITLNAPGGFIKYYWSPDYNINNRYSPNLQIVVHKDTTYTVIAEKAPGCLVADTIRLKVNIPVPVTLGNDTSLCKFDTMTLDAGSGFTDYAWNTGAVVQNIRVAAKGIYSVTVKDLNNCTSRDTIEIVNVQAPADFLTDTALCLAQQLELKAPVHYANYRWYNNSTAASVVVTAPGDYWLEVTDAAGCTGRDTVHVTTKKCDKGVYFPNAFTPNYDHLNHTFRPVVHGTLEKFKLIIFNRWGEKVFETPDATKGWNGFHKGTLQQTNTFVWFCTYKLAGAGQVEQAARGTVVLIR